VMDQYGVDSLNELPPNTEVLSGPIVTSILDGVTEALLGSSPNSLLSKVLDIVEEGIYDITLNLEIEASALFGAVDAPLYVHGTLGGFLGAADHADPVVDVSGLSLLGIDLGQVLQPVTNLLTGLVSDLGGALGDVVPGVLTSVQPALIETLEPLLDELLDGALEPVLNEVADIRINEQPTEAPINGVGDLGDDSFTVRALTVRVLPNIAGVGIELGSSSVRALDEDDAD